MSTFVQWCMAFSLAIDRTKEPLRSGCLTEDAMSTNSSVRYVRMSLP